MQSPSRDCDLCPRLVDFRQVNRKEFPDWHNAPVPSFGKQDVRLLVVGLAPGLKGANKTGRPFTGDYAGDLLYSTLSRYGFAEGTYGKQVSDGFCLTGCRVTNAVRCVPPKNKPVGQEIRSCGMYLRHEIYGMAELRVILALGVVAHGAVLLALDEKKKSFPFAHGAIHKLAHGPTLVDSYHCSRYNTNTGRLTNAMFYDVFDKISRLVET